MFLLFFFSFFHFYHSLRYGEEIKHKKFLAAREIQALYRGYYHRKNLKELTRKAIVVQKWIRGYLGNV